MRHIDNEVYRQLELTDGQLTSHTDADALPFESTAELPGLKEGIIGQSRAVEALAFGLNMEATGYNIFVSGPVGTGRTTYTMRVVEERALAQNCPDDWCYVYNFQSPDEPLAVHLPAGQGLKFRLAVENLVREVEQGLVQQFDSDEYGEETSQLLKAFNDKAEALWSAAGAKAQSYGMALQRTSTGVATVPLDEAGHPMRAEVLRSLDAQTLAELSSRQEQVQEVLDEMLRQMKTLQKEARREQQVLDEKTASFAISHLFEDVKSEFSNSKLEQYLSMMEQDIIQNQSYFHVDGDGDGAQPRVPGYNPLLELKRRYQVNVLVSHQPTSGSPVVLESNPTYFNLFGKVEYRGTQAGLTSDYTMVKPGALHLANGGYLVVQAQDLLSHPASWYGLKRALMRKEIRIDNPAEETVWISSSALRPEPIALNVKVILIGTPDIYRLLYEHDEAFHKFFKVKVEFDSQMPKTPETALHYANFIASYTKNNGLQPFSAGAVARVIDYSCKQTESQEKLSTRFNPVIEVIEEATYHARQQGQSLVLAKHVDVAIMEKRKRSDLIKEKVLELLLDGTIKVETRGERVGQINGLAVLNTGDFMFGQPHRITARTYIGRRGVINVERETAMSGSIHNKGLLILSGYLAGEFAQKEPLAISATLVFEQTYSMIDGDSASSTELYALLSALANVPIQQGIAVTGSVDQFGDVQPIGGVNEKIEGFFYVCQAQGLTGHQGVMIPYQNVPNLFLPEEVIAAVNRGEFHIWPVKTVKQGIEVLTGIEAGSAPYEEGTVYGAIERRLRQYTRGYGEEAK